MDEIIDFYNKLSKEELKLDYVFLTSNNVKEKEYKGKLIIKTNLINNKSLIYYLPNPYL